MFFVNKNNLLLRNGRSRLGNMRDDKATKLKYKLK